MINTHLDYVQDGPNRLAPRRARRRRARDRGGGSPLVDRDAAALGRPRLLDDGWPLLFTGDLNQPSHLDWTARRPPSTVASAPSPGRSARRWPTPVSATPTARRTRTRSPTPAPRGAVSPAARAARAGSTTRTSAARSRSRAARSSASSGGAERRPRLPEVDLGPPRRALAADRRAGADPDHRRPVEPDGHRRRRRDRDLPDARRPDGGTVTLTGPSSASYDVDRRRRARSRWTPTGSLPGGYRVDLPDGGGDVVADQRALRAARRTRRST